MTLKDQVKKLMSRGVYEPEVLFHRVYQTNRVHYSKVRQAIHEAKVS